MTNLKNAKKNAMNEFYDTRGVKLLFCPIDDYFDFNF